MRFFNDYEALLNGAGISCRRSEGGWVRICARWRGSLDFNVAVDSNSGGWNDPVTGEHGSWPALAALLGISTDASRRPTSLARSAVPQWAPAPNPKEDATKRIQRANFTWERGVSVRDSGPLGDWARHYLDERGVLNMVDSLDIRVRSLKLGGRPAAAPCLLWPIYSFSDSGLIGVQREWSRGHVGKKMLGCHIQHGEAGGFVIPAQDPTNRVLYIVEGPITGCAVALLTGGRVIVLFDVAGLSKFPLPVLRRFQKEKGREMVIAADHDVSGAGRKAAQACAQRILDAAPDMDIKITMPCEAGQDWADVWQQAGEGARCAFAANMVRPVLVSNLAESGRGDRGPAAQRLALPEPAEFPRMTLSDGTLALRRAVRFALESPGAHLVIATPGTGKTALTAGALRKGMLGPVLVLAPKLVDAKAIAALIPGARVHRGRCEQNCLRWPEMGPLIKAGRAPAWLCESCRHASPDANEPCKYMEGIRAEYRTQVVCAAHAAGQEDSVLFEHSDKGPERAVRRRLIVDEHIAMDRLVEIQTDDLQRVRQVLDEKLAEGRLTPAAQWEAASDHERLQALAWGQALAPELKRFAQALIEAPTPAGVITPLKDTDWSVFIALLTDLPEVVCLVDGTVVEGCVLRHTGIAVIPKRFLRLLAQSLMRGTAYIEGGMIHGAVPEFLFERLMRDGGLLLDATPTLDVVAQFAAREGHVHRVFIEEPFRRGIQYTGELNGRAGLTNRETLARQVTKHKVLLGPGHAATTHKPEALAIDWPADTGCVEVGYWGRDERAHNRWQDVTHLHAFGVRIPSPREQQIAYCIYEVRMREIGITVSPWDPETRHYFLDKRPGSSVRLPVDPHIRLWLIDRVSADVAQHEGRARACRRTAANPVISHIHTSFPLRGHGIVIHERHLGITGRAAQRAGTHAAVVLALATLGADWTKKAISDGVATQTGRRISNTTLDRIVNEIRVTARARGISLVDAARALADENGTGVPCGAGDAVGHKAGDA